MIGRIVSIGLAWTAMWWLLIGVVIAPVLPGGWTTIAAVIAASVAPLVIWTRRFSGDYPSAIVRLWVFRPFWYVQLATPFIAAAGVAGAAVGLLFGAPAITGRLAIGVVTAVFATAIIVGYIGSRRLRVKHLEVRLTNLPAGFDGLRIAQISDLHVGPHSSRRHLRRISQAVAAARPDVIAITGDQVDDYAGDVEHFAAAFHMLSAPDGVLAIPGNHDVFAGWPAVRRGLEGMGMTVLVNDAIRLSRNDEELWIVGTGDPAASGGGWWGADAAPDIERTLARVPPGAPTIALAHNPALWPALASRGVGLTLSGHTHYGQVSIPRMNWSLASLFLEHSMEWYRKGDSLLYINPGTNYWGLPLRIGALPEVTVLTLRAGRGECGIVATDAAPVAPPHTRPTRNDSGQRTT